MARPHLAKRAHKGAPTGISPHTTRPQFLLSLYRALHRIRRVKHQHTDRACYSTRRRRLPCQQLGVRRTAGV